MKRIALASFLVLILSGLDLPTANSEENQRLQIAAAPQKSAGGGSFSEGDLNKICTIPAAFGPYQSKSMGIGVYRGRLNIAAEDVKKPLFVVVRVQNDPAHRFGWMRVFANNKLVATEAGLNDNRIVQEVEGVLQAGDVQVAIMGMAYPGTNMDFYLVPKDLVLPCLQNPALGSENQQKTATIPESALLAKAPPAKAINISKILPQPEVMAGNTLEIQGDNFSANPAENRVYLGSASLSPKSLRSNWLSVDIPRDFASGTYRMIVDAGKARSKALGVTVIGYPRLKSLSATEVPPDAELAITGENFPENPSNLRVLFGSVPARILQTNRQRILVKVPNLAGETAYPIKVSVGQLSSAEELKVSIGNSIASGSSRSSQEPAE